MRFLLAGLLVVTLGAAPAIGRLADPTAAQVDQVFAQYDRTDSPGCALGVYRGGRIVYTRGYGMADLNQGIAIAPNTVFYIGSTSKQFAAFAIALAAEQGKVGLDDPVRKYVPELPASYADPITVRHLVHHTSGIRDYLGLWAISGRSFADEIPEPAALDLIGRQQALDFAPGARWSYSNSGYFLLSVIVKRATGLSLMDFAEKHMFGPLGMKATHFHENNRAIVPRRSEGYDPLPRGGFEIVRTSFALVGDGGLYTTVEDLLKWDENFYRNTLGSRGQALIDQVLTKGRLNNGDDTRYAFGLFPSTYRGLSIVEHGGAFIGYRAQLLRFPTEHFSVAVLCNVGTAAPEQLALKVADLYLADKLAAVPAPAGGTPASGVVVSPALLDRYVGRYEVSPGQVVRIRRDGAGLVADAFGQSFPLAASSDSVFTLVGPGATLQFRTGKTGGPELFAEPFSVGGAAPRLADPPPLMPSALAGYAGRFASDELDTWATVSANDGKLAVATRYGPPAPMEPLAPDAFTVRGAKIVFVRGPRGEVTGFKLSAARLANVEFRRGAATLPAPGGRRAGPRP